MAVAFGASSSRRTNSIRFLVVHGELADVSRTCLDAAWLSQRKPRTKHLVVAGDVNVDLLPSLQSGPYADLPGRVSHHVSQ